MRSEDLLLADIGNTYFHILNDGKVEHLTYADTMKKYREKELLYITVKHQFTKQIEQIKNWKNISSLIKIEGEYETMGVDRRALCLSHKNGIFVDAGSAITVDMVEEGVYLGGYIFPGIKSMLDSYENISPALKTDLNNTISLSRLPATTKDGISYGIIASIKALIDKHSDGKTLYFTGGDGQFLSTFFEETVYDELLVFRGMREALKGYESC